MKYSLCKNFLLLGFMLVMNMTLAQNKTVSGSVNDDQGTPLPGVNVIVQGTTNGTQTDFDGLYTISVSEGETLTFSYVGMATVSVVVTNSNTIDITL
ncbi:MAG: carboxypeptidase-like regulatory domain-containing protein, partial [Allomuricauda sp.]